MASMAPRGTGMTEDPLHAPDLAGGPGVAALYRARRDRVDFIDVPELGFAVVDGRGAPGGQDFTDAIQALFAASYGAHFAIKKALGWAPKMMPLEALWWIEGPDPARLMERLAMGGPGPGPADQSRWHWRALVMQLEPVDAAAIDDAVARAKAKKGSPALDAVRYERWAEGPSAQIMHVGPYSDEQKDISVLHQALAEHGYHPRGRHHEIYLGDPRRSAPERLRTILRHPYTTSP